MTKDQVSDLSSLIERVVQTEKDELRANNAVSEARRQLANYLHALKDESPTKA
jgi:hypothetical protein